MNWQWLKEEVTLTASTGDIVVPRWGAYVIIVLLIALCVFLLFADVNLYRNFVNLDGAI